MRGEAASAARVMSVRSGSSSVAAPFASSEESRVKRSTRRRVSRTRRTEGSATRTFGGATPTKSA
ncbi:MAG: hypothetical protein IPN17_19295 [Deltaproteobacteria bacterium]|nr:hypothetical protein [Deltaproteobacteria bacterium]